MPFVLGRSANSIARTLQILGGNILLAFQGSLFQRVRRRVSQPLQRHKRQADLTILHRIGLGAAFPDADGQKFVAALQHLVHHLK